MTTFGFIVRRIIKEIGICNRQEHSKRASKLSQKITDTKVHLGSLVWEEINEISELKEVYLELKSLTKKQENIKSAQVEFIESNNELKLKVEKIEFDSTQNINLTYKEKGDLSLELSELKKQIHETEEECKKIRKRFIGVDNSQENETVETFKSLYTKERQKLVKLRLELEEKNKLIKKLNEKLNKILEATKLEISETMNEVSKASKKVASQSAEIEAIESSKKEFFIDIGTFIFKNLESTDPNLQSLKEKYKLSSRGHKQLIQSMDHHSILAS